MAWMSVADARGRGWDVDLDAAAQLCYAEAFAYEQNDRTTFPERCRGMGYPTTYSAELRQEGFRAAVRQRADASFRAFQRQLWNDGDAAYRQLIVLRRDAVRLTARLRERQSDASRRTSTNIDRAVQRGEMLVSASRGVRDVSAGVLVLGATFLSGGAAIGVLGAGSALRGTGTYQDTGNVGAAVLTSTTTFAFGMIPLARGSMLAPGATLSAGEQTVMFFIGVQNNASTAAMNALVLGQDARSAIASSLVNSGMGWAVDRVTGDFLKSLSLPARVLTQTGRDRVRSAAAAQVVRSAAARSLPDAEGPLSVAASVVEGGSTDAQAENFVQLFAMAPDLTGATAPEGTEWMRDVMRGR
jgi:hypothetical protein